MLSKNKDTQVSQIKEVINKVVEAGPDFLFHKISADEMANIMVSAVDDFVGTAEKEGSLEPHSEEAGELMYVLREIKGCGSGFLADRCDSDCVAGTISYILKEFSE